MRLCIVSFKPCWQNSAGEWMSYGGFPLQMSAIASLFDRATLVVVRSAPHDGALPLPADTEVVGLRSPAGADTVRKLSVILQLFSYLRVIRSHVRDADVVHVPVPGDISFLGMLVALACRKKLIVRYGSSWVVTAQTTFMQRVTRGCMRLFAGGRNVMLATGVGDGPPAEGINWIFSTALTASELAAITVVRERDGIDYRRLVYVGRVSPEKGVTVLLRALRQLRDEGLTPMPRLAVLGDGPERESAERLTEQLQLTDIVRFAGHLNRADLFAELEQADMCVQPSLTEGFSKAWLDAMAHGLPVLSSRVGAAGSVIGANGERGWLVPPGEVGALAAALRQALTETRDWPALRARCRAFVEGRTLDAWAQEIGTRCAAQWGWQLTDGKLRA